MDDKEWMAQRERQIAEFRTAIGAAVEDALDARESGPIWNAFREFGHDHVVDFGDVRRALNIAKRLDKENTP
jgi:hypothetical protein